MLRLNPVAIGLAAVLVLSGCAAGLGGGLFTRQLDTRPGVVDSQTAARMISAYRASRGLGPVSVSPTLTRIASDHAAKMASMNRMAHVLPGQGSFKRRIASGGYRASLVAENVGAGYGSLETAIQRWKDSPSHDKNLLHPQITEIGIAVAHAPESRFKTYWSLVLAEPMSPQAAARSVTRSLVLARRQSPFGQL